MELRAACAQLLPFAGPDLHSEQYNHRVFAPSL